MVRDLVVIAKGHNSLVAWLKLKESERLEFRNKRFSDIVGKACTDAKLDKNITFHDLRHSYAIHLLDKGVSLDLAAQSLGDSIQVTQEHYTGFTLSKQEIEAIKQKLKANSAG